MHQPRPFTISLPPDHEITLNLPMEWDESLQNWLMTEEGIHTVHCLKTAWGHPQDSASTRLLYLLLLQQPQDIEIIHAALETTLELQEAYAEMRKLKPAAIFDPRVWARARKKTT